MPRHWWILSGASLESWADPLEASLDLHFMFLLDTFKLPELVDDEKRQGAGDRKSRDDGSVIAVIFCEGHEHSTKYHEKARNREQRRILNGIENDLTSFCLLQVFL
ncbi:hypothetical protein EYZ11_012201 [Aspergillus tanneri]|uniref:Uncharacterized protein n=1 Tax=Aspergillus tanneri TaxID=1220188 RepID=A0A4S3J143_9EURO|nr:hypothetical protein EYZ11_012201 [Aspergillus tanneri]